MDYISFNNPEDNNNNYKKYIIGSLILYIPLITFNIIIYTSIVSINNLINTQENIDYIHKIKHIIDDICNVINCSKTLYNL